MTWLKVDTHLSFTRYNSLGIDLGKVGWVIFAVLVIVGCSNAVNLTDGLDGLAAGSSIFAFAAFTVIGFYQLRHFAIYRNPAALDEAAMAAAMIGACAGFLWFNAAPARIFMGDTGSLGIGTAIAILALLENVDLLLLIIGGLFVHRDPVGDHPGGQLPAVPPPGVPDGADPPPLRAARLARDDGDHPVLDPGRAVHGPGPGRPSTPTSCPRAAPGERAARSPSSGFGVTGRAVARALLAGGDEAGRLRRRLPARGAAAAAARSASTVRADAGRRRALPPDWPAATWWCRARAFRSATRCTPRPPPPGYRSGPRSSWPPRWLAGPAARGWSPSPAPTARPP